jgi:hypothetical protein
MLAIERDAGELGRATLAAARARSRHAPGEALRCGACAERRPSAGHAGPRPKPLHPVNATLRFALELVALAALGRWGFVLSVHATRYLWMLAVPLSAGALWGTFTDT